MYVAFVIDAFARRIVGWRVSRTAHRDRPDAGLNLALAMMTVANDTLEPETSIPIARANRRRAPDRGTAVKGSPKMSPDGAAQQLHPRSGRILIPRDSAIRHRRDTPPSIQRVTDFRV